MNIFYFHFNFVKKVISTINLNYRFLTKNIRINESKELWIIKIEKKN